MDTLVEAVVSFFLVVGSFFMLVGALGLARLPDFYMRLHSPTKASTLGVGGILVASMIWFLHRDVLAMHELLIALFLFVTAPVSANLLAKAALHLRVKSLARLPEPDEPGGD
jgi:multicomponent K+:H+ antiporter subunit G